MCKKTFLYFAYGSNLLSKRIHIQNPSAVRRGIGRLKDYRLDFHSLATRWNGAPCTIVPDPGRHVWGALWEIGIDHMASLDDQEGVHVNHYRPLELPVETSDNQIQTCRVYMLVNNAGPLEKGQTFTDRPSSTYLHVIISGAIESGMPEEYVNWLKAVPHNGRQAVPEMVQALEGHLVSLDDVKVKTTPSDSPVLADGDSR